MFAPPAPAALDRFGALQSRPFRREDLPEIRRRSANAAGDRQLAPGVTVRDIEAAGVPVRLYRPPGQGPLPLHVFYHGGAVILGSALSGKADGPLSRRAAGAG